MITSIWVSFLANSGLIYNAQRSATKVLVAPITSVGHEEIRPPCGHFLQQQVKNQVIWAVNTLKDSRAVNATCPQEMSWGS